MPSNGNNPEVDAPTRKFAVLAGVGISEAIEHRHQEETPRATAARLRETHGITLGEAARTPLPREDDDAMWESR